MCAVAVTMSPLVTFVAAPSVSELYAWCSDVTLSMVTIKSHVVR